MENISNNNIDFNLIYKNIFNNDLPENIKNIKEKSFEKYNKIGLPTKDIEDYKYSNIKTLFTDKYKIQNKPYSSYENLKDIFKCNVPEIDSYTVFLINGWYSKENKIDNNGIEVCSLNDAFNDKNKLLDKYFNLESEKYNDSLISLNTAVFYDGVYIRIKKNTIIDKPIQVINILLGNDDLLVIPRNIIIADENSQAKIVVCNHTLNENNYLTNSVTEIYLNENANVDYYNMQSESNSATLLSSVLVNQKKSSIFTSNIISLHGGYIRNNLKISMDSENCETNAYGLYLMDKTQHIDNNTQIDHNKPSCTSKQLYKGILDDESNGAFSGKISVKENAQKTNAFQSNNNILLTDEAQMNTKPQLEIYADDVKCSHGATVGQLNEDAIFYLRARGIGVKEARKLMLKAFASEVINKINIVSLKERISDLVDKRLNGDLTKCANCSVKCS